MDMLKSFSVTFIELSSFMILWSKFSLKKEKVIIKNFVIVFITSAVVAAAYSINNYYSMICNYIVILCLISFFHDNNFIKSLIEVCINTLLLMISQLITMYLIKIFFPNWDMESFTFSLSIAVTIFILAVIIYYFAPDKNIYRTIELNSKILYYIVINFIGYILICKIIWEYNEKLILNNIIVFIVMLIAIFILNLFLCYHIVKINEEKKLIELHNRYNPIIENIIEEIRRKQHEFKNHLNTINGIVQVSKEEELKNSLITYIRSLNNSVKSIEDIIYIDSLVLRAIIFSKCYEAEMKNIKLSWSISNDLEKWNVKDYELSEILTNLLNNAFEAANNSTDRIVTLNIFKDENKNIIEVKNSGQLIKIENIKKIFNRGFSTKEGKNRGYGLYNVKKIAESNGGKIQLFFDNSYICFKVLI